MIFNQIGSGSSGAKQVVTEIFTASGTWTCPAGVDKVFVRLFGGGGGGGGLNEDNNYITGGGGGGGYMAYSALNVTPNSNYTVTIGAGGAGTSSGNGGTGGVTSFGILLSANGGSGKINLPRAPLDSP